MMIEVPILHKSLKNKLHDNGIGEEVYDARVILSSSFHNLTDNIFIEVFSNVSRVNCEKLPVIKLGKFTCTTVIV